MGPPLKRLKSAVVYFAISAGEDERRHDDEYQPFEVTVMSNRQLIFEQLDKPFTYGQLHLQLLRSLQLVKHGRYNMCLRLNLDEEECHMHHIELYCDTIHELREWEAQLKAKVEDSAATFDASKFENPEERDAETVIKEVKSK